MNEFWKNAWGIGVVTVLFVAMSGLVQYIRADLVMLAAGTGWYGMLFYVILTATAVVAAPVSTVPLMPLATGLWGAFATAALSIAGWTFGAAVAFVIARRYGQPFVGRMVPLAKLEGFERRLPRKNLFMTVVVMRMVLPVDFLSYALGLFSRMPLGEYVLATFLGVAPFAFVFAYAVELPVVYQVFGGVLLVLLFTLAATRMIKRRYVYD